MAPLHAATGEMVGLLSVDLPHDGRRPGPFARDALDMYTVRAGIAISNAKQREQAREEIRLTAVVRDVAAAVSGALNPAAVLQAAVDPTASGLRCDAVWVQALTDAGTTPAAAHRDHKKPSPAQPDDQVLDLAARAAQQAWAARRAAVLAGRLPTWQELNRDGANPPLLPQLEPHELQLARRQLADAGCRSLMLVPVGAGPQWFGYILLAHSEAAPWPVEEIQAAWRSAERSAERC
jgi:GAF domain-containing protein